MSGFSGNCLNSEALQGLSSLLVGVNPGPASSASRSWDSSNREESGLGHPGPGVHLPWSSPAVPAPGGRSLGLNHSGSWILLLRSGKIILHNSLIHFSYVF